MNNVFTPNNSQQEIFQRMIQSVTSGASTRPGTLMGDYLTANSIEDANIYQALDEVLNAAFLDTATGDYLDMLAEMYYLNRLQGTNASGLISVVINRNGTLPAGTQFRTNDMLMYETTLDVNYTANTPFNVTIQSLDIGVAYNILTTTTLVPNNFIAGFVSVDLVSNLLGGTDAETDDAYRQRIYEYVQSYGGAGNKSDYVIWAKSVDGVAGATCVPLWNGNGTVKVICYGANGSPLSQEIITNVQNYISPNPGTGEGVAPVGAWVTITTSQTQNIFVNVSGLVITPGSTLSTVQQEVTNAITNYILSINVGDDIIRQRVDNAILSVTGVQDFNYSQLSLDGTTFNFDNIPGDIDYKYIASNVSFVS